MSGHERKPRPEEMDRRRFLRLASGGVLVSIAGMGCRPATEEEASLVSTQTRPDGRPRIPPGQYLLKQLRPMGGAPGDPSPAKFRLRVHGEVTKPLEIDFAALLRMPQTEQTCDVHCVTKWSVLDSQWTGVRVSHLAELAGMKDTARHVIFEGSNGYTANILLEEALQPNVLVAHRLNGDPLPLPNGPPARALVPDLYFWKSAKWLSGIRFIAEDKPGFWETRGYHNHADPWREERYG